MQYTIKLFLIFVLWTLAGCSAVPVIEDPEVPYHSSLSDEDDRWRLHYQTLHSMKTFSFQSRVFLKTPDIQQQFQMEGIFDKGLFIDMSGPFKLGKARLILHPGKRLYVLMTGNGRYIAKDANELTEGLFSVPVPIEAFASWIKGIPHDMSLTETLFDSYGRLTAFYENGFHVTLSDYKTMGQFTFPGKIKIERDDFLIKMVVSSLAAIHKNTE